MSVTKRTLELLQTYFECAAKGQAAPPVDYAGAIKEALAEQEIKNVYEDAHAQRQVANEGYSAHSAEAAQEVPSADAEADNVSPNKSIAETSVQAHYVGEVVRSGAAILAPAHINCKAKRENGGVCPHHNLQCGWPKCNEAPAPANRPSVPEEWRQTQANAYVRICTTLESIGFGLLSRNPTDSQINDTCLALLDVLSAAPQEPAWQELSEEEIANIYAHNKINAMFFARAISVALRAKNGSAR